MDEGRRIWQGVDRQSLKKYGVWRKERGQKAERSGSTSQKSTEKETEMGGGSHQQNEVKMRYPNRRRGYCRWVTVGEQKGRLTLEGRSGQRRAIPIRPLHQV